MTSLAEHLEQHPINRDRVDAIKTEMIRGQEMNDRRFGRPQHPTPAYRPKKG